AFAEQAEREVHGAGQDAALARLTREEGNLRAALRWSVERSAAETALRLSGALGSFWDARVAMSEAREWLDRALALAGGPPAARARGREALALGREPGHALNTAMALELLAMVDAREARPQRAARLWGAAAVLRESIGAPPEVADLASHERTLTALRAALGEGA